MFPYAASADELNRRDEVLARIVEHVLTNRTIKLPVFDPNLARPNDRFALINIGLEPNDFSGSLGVYRYQFEGEEDLLHLIVTTETGDPLTPEEGQRVASFALSGLSPALIWLRPGELSQHFYFGHDDLVAHLETK
ncbi:hypothetical protein [Fimbriimonas ginsengisoli]|uniref:Uncharacterized protein n=1 Tax=Fimbriimonas ginsengisoli Gsoil 348 TaxID=661478 RepID=A0A068NY32_FIMGI|nr:hypothetical protein [Fimbriimonas ginsengisoli]AIE87800.1 hypothetical protein OP10G_4432 [Fimbriimonas ginsengisoli Gsoil 348]